MLLVGFLGVSTLVCAQFTQLEAFDYLSNAIEQSAFAECGWKRVPVSDNSGFQYPALYVPGQRVAALPEDFNDNGMRLTEAPDCAIMQYCIFAFPWTRVLFDKIVEFEPSEVRYAEKELKEKYMSLIGQCYRIGNGDEEDMLELKKIIGLNDELEREDVVYNDAIEIDDMASEEPNYLQAFDHLCDAIQRSPLADIIIKMWNDPELQYPASFTPVKRAAAFLLSRNEIDDDRLVIVAPGGSICFKLLRPNLLFRTSQEET